MKLSNTLSVAALAGSALAMPAGSGSQACTSDVTLSGNPFTTRKLHANSNYKQEVMKTAKTMNDTALSTKALKVADYGSFIWMDSIASVPKAAQAIADVSCDEILGLVVYDLPGRDCAAKASLGELKTGELDKYKNDYIDPIVKMIKANPKTAFALVIEPDSLPNLVTNTAVPACVKAASDYEAGVTYALQSLNLPNVIMYMDAGHGGWLGWSQNLKPGAEELAKVYKAAGSPKQVRGFSTNVSGYNAYSLMPGEWSNSTDGKYNMAADENRFIELIGAEMKTAGMPNNAITDTGRNGVTGIRKVWGDWCNVKGAGFGMRPAVNTNSSSLTDAFVWVKPPGESDGTSDTTAHRYDPSCGADDAYKPSPDAGAFNQAYFQDLVKNANPPL